MKGIGRSNGLHRDIVQENKKNYKTTNANELIIIIKTKFLTIKSKGKASLSKISVRCESCHLHGPSSFKGFLHTSNEQKKVIRASIHRINLFFPIQRKGHGGPKTGPMR